MIEFDDITHRPMWRKIHEHVAERPARLDMSDWQEVEVWAEQRLGGSYDFDELDALIAKEGWCGTSACIAGWAWVFAGNEGLLEAASEEEWKAVGDSLGIPTSSMGDHPIYYLNNIEGQEVIRLVAEEGLSPHEAYRKVRPKEPVVITGSYGVDLRKEIYG